MNHILKIRNIKRNNKDIGFIGVDLETGIYKYYSTVGRDSLERVEKPFCIDIQSSSSSYLNYLLRQELKSLNASLLNNHIQKYEAIQRSYNLSKGFSNNDLDRNIPSLISEYRNDLWGSYFTYGGKYNFPLNEIIVSTNKNWYDLTQTQMKLIEDVVIHEVGHMAVSKYTYKACSKELDCHIGFITFTIVLVTAFELEEDIIYIPAKKRIAQDFTCLEETINEFECSNMKADYHFRYPEYGYLLSEISDGSLVRARHEGNIVEYFRVMKDLISDECLANELLELMNSSIESDNKEQRDKSFRLLQKYRDVKSQKNL